MEINDLFAHPFSKIILSNKQDKARPYHKITVTPVVIKNNPVWQITSYTETQTFHENIGELNDVQQRIVDLFNTSYKQINAFYPNEVIEFRKTKQGKILSSRHSVKNTKTPTNHNRTKNYLIPEGQKIDALIDIGIMTTEGKIIRAQSDKFRQINKFLEIIDDTLKDWSKPDINVLDFGCGKSYLTFVLYHYLTHIKGLNAHIVGLDLKADVIKKCTLVAEKYGYQNLKFELGDIQGYTPLIPIDMVISLHACDTATDHALYNAIQWNVPMILAVPCCQHEVNSQINTELKPLTKYGLLKERFSTLLTDAIRANILESQGYTTQVLEFVDISHTPKNVLIRAVKTGKKKSLEDTKTLCDQFNIQPTLLRLIKNA